MIGAVLIVATDLFILGGKEEIWRQKTTAEQLEQMTYMSSLRTQHDLYMKRGIDTDSYLPDIGELSAIEPASGGSMNDQASSSAHDPALGQTLLVEEVSIDELIASEKATELAAIQPAIGVEGEGIRSGFNPDPASPFADRVDTSDQNTRSVIDVISNLGVEPDDVILPSKTSQSVDIGLSTDTEFSNSPTEEPVTYTTPTAKGQVVIIIDDMGLGLRSKLVEVMQGPLTLAYLPYGKNLQERISRAKEHGHEIMLHMPMEAMNRNLDGGPQVLRGSLDNEQFDNTLEWGLSRFDGFVGVNNHMGSRLTQNRQAMARVMSALKERNLYFVDSKTIGSSVAADMARDAGISYAERDVFLDHEITVEFINGALKKLEKVAQKKGYAIGIGHPHQATITALKTWIPTLKDKGLTLVPASAVLSHPDTGDDAVAGAAH